MYYEEQWIEGALCWRTSPDGAWTRYTANELAHRYESAEKRAADAQATVDLAKAEGAAEVRKVIQQRLIDVRLARSVARLSFAQDEYDAQISALESILKQCEEPFSSNNENGPDWQATVEALQAQLVTLKRHAGLDCGDQSCLYALEHSGMRTNGGCRCSPKRMKDDLERSRKAVEALQRERDEAIREHGKESGFWGRSCARLLDKRDELQAALTPAGEGRMSEMPRFDNDIEQLKSFYDVTNEKDLIVAMDKHIARLQNKIRQLLPPEPAVRQVRA